MTPLSPNPLIGRQMGGQALVLVMAVFVAAITAGSAYAQAPPAGRAAFEVASVRQNKEPGLGNWRTLPGGRFVATKVALRQLIRIAYGVDTLVKPQEQILNLPGWVDSQRYDIDAKAATEWDPDPTAARTQALAMLQTLLDERFKITARLEKQERSIFELVMARSDKRWGPDLRRPAFACGPDAPPPPAGKRCGVVSEGQALIGHSVTFDLLVTFLTISPAVGRIVLNHTGLDGLFDIRLEFARPFVLGPGGVTENPNTDSGPTIFTALQEQLGLKLEPIRAPIDVLVVEQIAQLEAE